MKEEHAVIIDIGLRVLSLRVLIILALFLNVGVFAYALWADTWTRIVAAALFAIASWCFIFLRPKGVSHET